jgi:hypothetical protein
LFLGILAALLHSIHYCKRKGRKGKKCLSLACKEALIISRTPPVTAKGYRS